MGVSTKKAAEDHHPKDADRLKATNSIHSHLGQFLPRAMLLQNEAIGDFSFSKFLFWHFAVANTASRR